MNEKQIRIQKLKEQFSCEYGGKLSIGCGCGGCTAYHTALEYEEVAE